jgi:23S rRNA (cytidine1920-2'-O)/16S rRNA (cytidine1409-2'-O)-methyltransferase
MPYLKIRLDDLLVSQGWYADKDAAARAILAGDVTSPRLAHLKPGLKVSPDVPLSVRALRRYASRGGEKLEAALTQFGVCVAGLDCIDIGAGSGGFSDCLLSLGAASVTAVDVGYGQFDWRLRQDDRVTLLERTNFRTLPPPGPEAAFDLAVADLSFTRTSSLLSHVRDHLKPTGQALVLVKPQFELMQPQALGPGFANGVVIDPALHEQVLASFIDSAAAAGLVARGLIPSPLLGPDGNREFLFWATLAGRPATIDVRQAVAMAWR